MLLAIGTVEPSVGMESDVAGVVAIPRGDGLGRVTREGVWAVSRDGGLDDSLDDSSPWDARGGKKNNPRRDRRGNTERRLCLLVENGTGEKNGLPCMSEIGRQTRECVCVSWGWEVWYEVKGV